ncbi:uncharacterized protein EV420DRAFT_1482301 [Desarmillaria tabescens]|uniref:Uncharacterized protein n=1 Tax=Armillaria tabescens TaxID=1929756 RepID=A0AA39MZU8_ARMTA|nr:uncharacterized protein EV420DRAFT_1482301 [Desarmillaria tabescens]KAK0451955.1 hypothetical protein EV420DRAFT_1482301 [Desarmillaria tabescens]
MDLIFRSATTSILGSALFSIQAKEAIVRGKFVSSRVKWFYLGKFSVNVEDVTRQLTKQDVSPIVCDAVPEVRMMFTFDWSSLRQEPTLETTNLDRPYPFKPSGTVESLEVLIDPQNSSVVDHTSSREWKGFVLLRGSSRIYAQGVKSTVELALSGSINMFVPKPAFYVRKSIGRQPFFERDKTKQNLCRKRGESILDEALCHFSIRSGSVGWHSSQNLSGIKHYTIRGFNVAGAMVFMAELSNRGVDSAAWIYRVNQTSITFKTHNYERVLVTSKSWYCPESA